MPEDLVQGEEDVVGALPEAREDDLLFADFMGKNYLLYSVSVLVDRALPDVRDGLLPVQRRILYAMSEMRLRSNGSYTKCAQVTGKVMGSYHPHGDMAIYGAMVRMAQDFSLRVPLIDPHGNFGSIDGDPAGAHRYTECRLSPAAEEVLGSNLRVGDKAVSALSDEVLGEDYGRNYDESLREAKVLPASFPNLLVNGNTGIAVGMIHSSPAHNPSEVLDLAIWRLGHPEASDKQALRRLPGPDFPTGALVVRDEALEQAYLTGEGRLTVIGEAHIEPIPGNREKIVVTSLPFGVSKGQGFIEALAKQWQEGKWPELSDLNDFSDEDMRVEMELKRGTHAPSALARLYKDTRLRTTFPMQMNVLVDGRPRTLGVIGVLDHWLAFRREVIVRAARKRLADIEQRLHRLEALIKAIDAIDAVVAAIKSSPDRAAAKPKLRKLLKIDEQQATWIVEMPLGNLTSLESKDLREEEKALQEEAKGLRVFIKTPAQVTDKMAEDLRDLRKLLASPRKTRLISGEDVVEAESGDVSAPAEDCLALISRSGRAACGTGSLARGASLQIPSGDAMVVAAPARTDQDWIVFAASGKAFRLRLADLPLISRRDKGCHLSEAIGIEQGDDVVAAFPLEEGRKGTALFAYESGAIKRTEWAEYARAVPSGLVAAAPKPGDRVQGVHDCPEGADIILVGSHGKGIRFPAAQARPMGRVAAGVRGIKLPEGMRLLASAVSPSGAGALVILTSTGHAKRIPLDDFPQQGRDGSGVALMGGAWKPGGKHGDLSLAALVADGGSLLVQREGKLQAVAASDVPRATRAIVPKRFALADGAQALLAALSE
jgi:DNA gyrase subunit A